MNPFASTTTQAWASSWRLVIEGPEGPGLAGDDRLLGELLRAEGPGVARLWESPRTLVVSRKDSRLPRFAEAATRLAARGWPVQVRSSGGSAVPLGPGVVNLSLVRRLAADEPYDLEGAYHGLCAPIQEACRRLGLETRTGAVPGAYCDGRFNLEYGGRKLCGTAQRLVRGRGDVRVLLSQAMIQVASDPRRGTCRVNGFYRLAGGQNRYRAAAVSSLHLELRRPPEALLRAFKAEIRAALKHQLALLDGQ